jgi:O-acetyl-ADP-ribose deacetylase (regulator of RNase III)
MGTYNEVKGDLIALAKQGTFDVICHGVNCFCTMGAGIAPQMAKAFGCDQFPLEDERFNGDINKLGTIDVVHLTWDGGDLRPSNLQELFDNQIHVSIVNAYTQYGMGVNHQNGSRTPLDYQALTLCLRKMNHIFKGKHIGLPQIGCGLAGGDWDRVKDIIQSELIDCKVTVVIYEPKTK